MLKTVARRWLVALVSAVIAAVGLSVAAGRAEEAPTIAAAADLQFALTDVVAAFKAETGRDVKLTFGSSGNFFRQIQEGAPFEMFLSADEKFVFDLAEAGRAKDDGELYAIGRIVIMIPHGSPLKADGTLADLKAGIADGRVTRFAIANPEHAPYGRRAEEVLKHEGLWQSIQDKLVLGENVSQAAQFATGGTAQGGIIAYSLALAPDVSKLGEFELIPDAWHEPLRQRMALLKGASETTELFYAFMQQKPAREIMQRYGFVLPGEAM